MGLPFSRFDNGSIYQRPFGGQSKILVVSKRLVQLQPNRTGHALLHTLYQQNIKHKTTVSLSGMHWILLKAKMVQS